MFDRVGRYSLRGVGGGGAWSGGTALKKPPASYLSRFEGDVKCI